MCNTVAVGPSVGLLLCFRLPLCVLSSSCFPLPTAGGAQHVHVSFESLLMVSSPPRTILFFARALCDSWSRRRSDKSCTWLRTRTCPKHLVRDSRRSLEPLLVAMTPIQLPWRQEGEIHRRRGVCVWFVTLCCPTGERFMTPPPSTAQEAMRVYRNLCKQPLFFFIKGEVCAQQQSLAKSTFHSFKLHTPRRRVLRLRFRRNLSCCWQHRSL